MDNREKVHSSANFLVNVLHKVFCGDDMIEPCLQSLDKLKKSKGRISLLEIINVVVPKYSFFLFFNILINLLDAKNILKVSLTYVK